MFAPIISWLAPLGISDWRDCVEIALLSTAFYALCTWLSRDVTRPLLGIVYGYCCLTIVCRTLDLVTLTSLLLASAPIIAALAILFHQDTLQRRIIMYRSRINASPKETTDWLELIIRSGLIALNQGKEFFIIIEHHHELTSVLQTELLLKTTISDSLLSVVTSSSLYSSSSALWIKSNGYLQGINVQWNITEHQMWHDEHVKELPLWKQDALLMTLKTDAIICKALPESRAFDIVIAGKIFERISATQALMLMKKHLNYHPTTPEGGITYETSSVTPSREQRLS